MMAHAWWGISGPDINALLLHVQRAHSTDCSAMSSLRGIFLSMCCTHTFDSEKWEM